MVSIIAVKLLGAAWITLMSALGIWAPFLCVGRTGTGLRFSSSSHNAGGTGRQMNLRPSHVPSGRIFLSLVNCFSAGMLLTMALIHFFPSALSAADEKLTPPLLSCWMLVGVLIPALLEHGAGDSGGAHTHSHSHGVSSGAGHGTHNSDKERSKPLISTATLLLILMCFHGMMEGLLLGLEQQINSLVSAATPLSIHRFFDGLVIGVSMAKEVLRSLRNELSDPESLPLTDELSTGDTEAAAKQVNPSANKTSAEQRLCSEVGERRPAFAICGRRVWQPSVVLWLALTPATLIAVLLVTTFSGLPTAQEAKGVAQSVRPFENAKAKNPQMQWMAIAQAVGSGSFVYVGLSIILQEELKGLKADAAMLLGVIFTLLLFTLSGEEE